MGKRADCFALFVFLLLMIVVWLFLKVSMVYLQFVIVLFCDHTHLLFFYIIYERVGVFGQAIQG